MLREEMRQFRYLPKVRDHISRLPRFLLRERHIKKKPVNSEASNTAVMQTREGKLSLRKLIEWWM